MDRHNKPFFKRHALNSMVRYDLVKAIIVEWNKPKTLIKSASGRANELKLQSEKIKIILFLQPSFAYDFRRT